MSRHDYSQSTVSSVSDAIINCKNTVENTVLSIDTMPYPWDSGIINNVVTWFEVLKINYYKDELKSVFEKADSRFSGTVQDIDKADSGASSKFESTVNELSKTVSKLSDLENLLLVYGQISEHHVWMNEKEARIYKVKKYVTYDKSTGKYKYNWPNFAYDIQNGNLNEDAQYEKIIYVLYTMVDEEGNINTKELESFLEILASNGYNIINSTKKPSDQNLLKITADGLEQTCEYYVNAVKSETDDVNIKKMKACLSLINIVIATAKTTNVSYETIGIDSYARVESLNDISNGDLTFWKDGELYCKTKLQPKEEKWVKTDKTPDELKKGGIEFRISGGGVYIREYNETIYRVKVNINIDTSKASYHSTYKNNEEISDCNKYSISSTTSYGTTHSIVYDYSTDKRIVTMDFTNEYIDCWEDKTIEELESMKKDEIDVGETVQNKVESKILSKVKKYTLKVVEEFIPGAGIVEEIAEDVITTATDIDSDKTEINDFNTNIDKIIENIKNKTEKWKEINSYGDDITEDDNVSGIATIIYLDEGKVKVFS